MITRTGRQVLMLVRESSPEHPDTHAYDNSKDEKKKLGLRSTPTDAVNTNTAKSVLVPVIVLLGLQRSTRGARKLALCIMLSRYRINLVPVLVT